MIGAWRGNGQVKSELLQVSSWLTFRKQRGIAEGALNWESGTYGSALPLMVSPGPSESHMPSLNLSFSTCEGKGHGDGWCLSPCSVVGQLQCGGVEWKMLYGRQSCPPTLLYLSLYHFIIFILKILFYWLYYYSCPMFFFLLFHSTLYLPCHHCYF